LADDRHIKALKAGTHYWNFWREDRRKTNIDLTNADLQGINLKGVNLAQVNLEGCNLSGSNLYHSDLSLSNLDKSNLSQCDLRRAMFFGTQLANANLSLSFLSKADFTQANLSGADLTRAHLQFSTFIETTVAGTILTNCSIYGISVWNLKGTISEQTGLIITPEGEQTITVDDLKVAQFIYLLLNRDDLRNVLNTITSKAVLILGRFSLDRKTILNSIANELRMHNLLPIIFDFEQLTSRDFTETIKILAGISLFIIADVTNPKSSPLELQAIIPDYQVPLVPIIQAGEEPFSMLSSLVGAYDWVVEPILTYTSKDNLLAGFKEAIIERAWRKHQELRVRKTAIIKTQSIDEFLTNL
jgi:hypothetical protein